MVTVGHPYCRLHLPGKIWPDQKSEYLLLYIRTAPNVYLTETFHGYFTSNSWQTSYHVFIGVPAINQGILPTKGAYTPPPTQTSRLTCNTPTLSLNSRRQLKQQLQTRQIHIFLWIIIIIVTMTIAVIIIRMMVIVNIVTRYCWNFSDVKRKLFTAIIHSVIIIIIEKIQFLHHNGHHGHRHHIITIIIVVIISPSSPSSTSDCHHPTQHHHHLQYQH